MDRRTRLSDTKGRRDENRLFVALETSDEIKDKLCRLQFRFPGLKWTPSDQIHLTLRFVGTVSTAQMAAIRRALFSIQNAPFRLVATGLGLFSRKTGGILWVGVNDEPALHELKRKVDEALCVAASLRLEDTPFSPHFTLSRLREMPPKPLKNRIKEMVDEVFGEMRANGFTLFRSHLRPSGAVHEVLERYSLGP
jgi:2'-5' RNA ligase